MFSVDCPCDSRLNNLNCWPVAWIEYFDLTIDRDSAKVQLKRRDNVVLERFDPLNLESMEWIMDNWAWPS